MQLIAANIEESLLPRDKAIEIIKVGSAAELGRALDGLSSFDLLFMAAAVADYRPAMANSSKIKRDGSVRSLDLVENPDLLAQFASKQMSAERRGIIVGFAAESAIDETAAREKLNQKGVDFLFVNDIAANEVFNSDSNGGILISRDGERLSLQYQPKDTLSHALLDAVAQGIG